VALPVDFTSMLHALKTEIPALTSMVTALMFLTGFIFIFRALYALKLYGEARTMMSSNAELKGPLILFLVGTILLFYPTLFSTSLSSIFGTSNILAYIPSASDTAQEQEVMKDVGMIIQFVGVVAFFRGWLIVQALAGHSQQASLGKALTHIIGGILLVNVFATWNVLKSALGLG
jgi:intracellular multiplication protein IcmC